MYSYKFVGIPTQIYTQSGLLIATGFTRIVYGKRGAYVEFSEDQICKTLLSTPDYASWRQHRGSMAYYYEYRTPDGVKIYHQIRKVDYADYIPKMLYISPVFLRDFIRDAKI